jgi:hypothetical protein
VIGATGILRPALVTLAAGGHRVLAVARGAERLAGLAPSSPTAAARIKTLAHDARDASFPSALAAALDAGDLVLDAALVYGPATSPSVVGTLSAMWPVPVVEILTSAVAAPDGTGHDWSLEDLPRVPGRRHRVVLGWEPSDDGSRWHTPEEVSAAALTALQRHGDRLLGVVAPWSERPG